jgi:hypothetical protein
MAETPKDRGRKISIDTAFEDGLERRSAESDLRMNFAKNPVELKSAPTL